MLTINQLIKIATSCFMMENKSSTSFPFMSLQRFTQVLSHNPNANTLREIYDINLLSRLFTGSKLYLWKSFFYLACNFHLNGSHATRICGTDTVPTRNRHGTDTEPTRNRHITDMVQTRPTDRPIDRSIE